MSVTLAPCPSHPTMLLPIAARDAERLVCPICAQERRKRTYAAQLAQWRHDYPDLAPSPVQPAQAAGDGPRPEALAAD